MSKELAEKQNEWFRSQQAMQALNTDILHLDSYGEYLRNRLEAAFLAGAKAQRELLNKED